MPLILRLRKYLQKATIERQSKWTYKALLFHISASVGVKIGVKQVSMHFVLCQKVTKTSVFDKKTDVFMVAEAGLEPTTSGL